MSQGSGIHAEGLGKRFGDLWALRDLDLDVPSGTVLGLLGHNGAGKTTAIRILTTLAAPTEGRASVAGFDVVETADEVRRRIGVAAQEATVDGLLTGRFNLEMVGRLYHLPRARAKAVPSAPWSMVRRTLIAACVSSRMVATTAARISSCGSSQEFRNASSVAADIVLSRTGRAALLGRPDRGNKNRRYAIRKFE